MSLITLSYLAIPEQPSQHASLSMKLVEYVPILAYEQWRDQVSCISRHSVSYIDPLGVANLYHTHLSEK